jgi:DNA-directed RNA polymerase subunit RPC12/RpoP
MNNSEEMVRFTCPHCEKRLKSPASFAGRRCRCPRCSILMEIPGPLRALAVQPVVHPVTEHYPVAMPARQEQAVVHPTVYPVAEHYPVAMPARPEQAGVPFNVTLPHNMGGIQTTVSKGTANSIVKTVIGGILVALGVVVMAMFGIRRPRA